MHKYIQKNIFNSIEQVNDYQGNVLLKEVKKHIMPCHKLILEDLLNNDSEPKYINSILEENCLKISCDINKDQEKTVESYNISKIESGIIQVLSFIHFETLFDICTSKFILQTKIE